MLKAKSEKDKAQVSLLEDAKLKAERSKEKKEEEVRRKEMLDENILVRDSDLQLTESLNILKDLIELQSSASSSQRLGDSKK